MSPAAYAREEITAALERIDWDFADENPSTVNMRQNGVHWYPATFVAPLIGTLLDILGPHRPANVLDPFCGSGTAALEAWFRGYRALGSDNSSFAVALCKARTSILRHGSARTGHRIADAFGQWATGARADAPALAYAHEFANIDREASRWFVPAALDDIALVKSWIELSAPARWRPSLRVLLSSLLKRSSRVRDYHYTYIVDRSRVAQPASTDPRLAQLFEEKLHSTHLAAERLRGVLGEQGLANLAEPPVFTRARAERLSHIQDGAVQLILTSPPYFGMNDYVRSQYLTSLVYPSGDYERDLRLESGSRRDRNSPAALADYVKDMAATFKECRRVLDSDGQLVLFLGHSRSRLARESELLERLAGMLAREGFEKHWGAQRRIRFRKITSTPSSSEHVWVLRRS